MEGNTRGRVGRVVGGVGRAVWEEGVERGRRRVTGWIVMDLGRWTKRSCGKGMRGEMKGRGGGRTSELDNTRTKADPTTGGDR